MNIGFYIRWPKNSLAAAGANVLGDELLALSMCRELSKRPEVDSCELFAPGCLPARRLDLMVYMNETPPMPKLARRHLRYMQNIYHIGSDRMLEDSYRFKYDGYAFISAKLLGVHRQTGRGGLFLPFGADTSVFKPVPKEAAYAYEVAYVGNDIKGRARSEAYLCPALGYDFGLFGNWAPTYGWKLWKYLRPVPEYKKVFGRIHEGKIPQEKVPVLYSSAAAVLNCTAQDAVDWDVISLRSLEVLACGGFLISDRVPSAEKELRDCAVFTDGGKDLSEKIQYYLARPEERLRIAAKGPGYVLKNAALSVRVDALLGYIGTLL